MICPAMRTVLIGAITLLAVAGGALLLLIPFRLKGGESKVRLVGSIAIAMVGIFWTCEHLF